MVSTRSMTTRTKARRSAIAIALPHEVVVDIIGREAASSTQPMADLCTLRATVSKERVVGRRVALEREEAMKWLDNERYLVVINHLADADNIETCFIVGLTLVFAHHDMQHSLVCLDRATVAGHKAAAYVLGLLYMGGEAPDVGKHYISQVEDESAKRTNRECIRCQRLTTDVVREATWKKMGGPQGQVLALPKDDHQCTSTDCSVTKGWDDYVVFCSDDCMIRHKYAKFFTQV